MRALHISAGNLYGGLETLLLALARNRASCPGLENEIALCFEGRQSRELDTVGVPVHRLPAPRMSRPHTILRARHGLASLLVARDFDCVICHTHWVYAMFGPAVRRAGLPLALWVHAPLFGRHWSERWAAWTTPDLAICTSEFVAATLPALFDAVPVAVIHPLVDHPPAPLSAADRAAVRRELDTADDLLVIVQASRTEAWKGHAVLLDALGELRDQPSWIWWQLGGAQRPFEGVYLESLRERAVRLGIADRVRFAGERQDVRRLLGAADIFCQANLNPEPFGIAFIEALGAGLPVVTAAMGGALEIVDDSCGILVPSDDVAALAASLRRLIDDPALRARLSAGGPARARQISDPATQMRRLSDALHGLRVHVAQ
jgi:glycosyltransferase involved in cell wall biosynthesis